MPLAEFNAVWNLPEAYWELTGELNDNMTDFVKKQLAKKLLEDIQKAELINYQFCQDYPYSCIKASILVGRKERE